MECEASVKVRVTSDVTRELAKYRRHSVVFCADPVGNVSKMLFPERLSSKLGEDGEWGRPHTLSIIPK